MASPSARRRVVQALSTVVVSVALLAACGDEDSDEGGSQSSAPEVSEQQAERAARSAAAGAGFSTVNGQQDLKVNCRTLSGGWSCELEAVKNPGCAAVVRIPKRSKQPVADAKVVQSAQSSQAGVVC